MTYWYDFNVIHDFILKFKSIQSDVNDSMTKGWYGNVETYAPIGIKNEFELPDNAIQY